MFNIILYVLLFRKIEVAESCQCQPTNFYLTLLRDITNAINKRIRPGTDTHTQAHSLPTSKNQRSSAL